MDIRTTLIRMNFGVIALMSSPAEPPIDSDEDTLYCPVLSSCGEGSCGTCETTVLSGIPDHRDPILTDEEHDAGDTMMICLSRSCSARLVLDL
jgi:ferredoxin